MKGSYMKNSIVKISLVAAMVLTTGAYSAQIVGADASDGFVASDPQEQFGFGGLNLDNIAVNMFTAEGNISTAGTFDPADGSYPEMALGDFYQSDVFSRLDPTTKLGYLTQKIWPISEPTGLKIINNDVETNKYKPNNCIIGSSYLGDSNTSDPATTTHFLNDPDPRPTICSSYAGSSKRLQLILNENMVAGTATGAYGKHIDLVFNIDPETEAGDHKYQVFQKVTNHTGMRLDGLKVQVLNANGEVITSDLNISLGLGEGNPEDGGNIFADYEMAFYPPGLWGDGTKEHLPIGWFDKEPSGYLVDGNGTSEITTGVRLGGNYVEIYGNWLPAKWVGVGMHEEFSPTEEPALLAYWGTTPDQNISTDAPAWYYGMYNNEEEFTNFSSPTAEELAAWAADMKTEDNPDGKYVIDDIEDLPNLSLNYIVNVGEGVTDKFIIRFIPKVSVDQTPPSYFEDDGVTRIEPPAIYNDSKGIVVITPEPTFVPGEMLTVGVADGDLNTDPLTKQEVDVNVTNDSGDVETITLMETEAYTGVFSGTLSTVADDSNVSQDGNMTVSEGTVVTVFYTDEDNGTAAVDLNASTTAQTPTTPPVVGGGSSGGGCTYNPNSKNFDMTFLMLMALGLLYPFRRRFLK